jgi:hypothetical protein
MRSLLAITILLVVSSVAVALPPGEGDPEPCDYDDGCGSPGDADELPDAPPPSCFTPILWTQDCAHWGIPQPEIACYLDGPYACCHTAFGYLECIELHDDRYDEPLCPGLPGRPFWPCTP